MSKWEQERKLFLFALVCAVGNHVQTARVYIPLASTPQPHLQLVTSRFCGAARAWPKTSGSSGSKEACGRCGRVPTVPVQMWTGVGPGPVPLAVQPEMWTGVGPASGDGRALEKMPKSATAAEMPSRLNLSSRNGPLTDR